MNVLFIVSDVVAADESSFAAQCRRPHSLCDTRIGDVGDVCDGGRGVLR
jgi:hypothetical protein